MWRSPRKPSSRSCGPRSGHDTADQSHVARGRPAGDRQGPEEVRPPRVHRGDPRRGAAGPPHPDVRRAGVQDPIGLDDPDAPRRRPHPGQQVRLPLHDAEAGRRDRLQVSGGRVARLHQADHRGRRRGPQHQGPEDLRELQARGADLPANRRPVGQVGRPLRDQREHVRQGAAGLLLRDGRQPEQQPGQPLLGLRQARQDQGPGLPDLLVLGFGQGLDPEHVRWSRLGKLSTSGAGAGPVPGGRAPGGPGGGRFGIYVHCPYCRTKCPYCDFNVAIHREDRIAPFVAALRAEIARYAALPWAGRIPAREPVLRRRHARPPPARGGRGGADRRPPGPRARAGRRGHAGGES